MIVTRRPFKGECAKPSVPPWASTRRRHKARPRPAPPPARLREIYEVVLAAQLAGVEAAVPGAALVDVDEACRDIIDEAGYGEYFVHSTGHGIGLEVHEAPSAARTGRGELAEGMTLTIEPGIYLPGEGGVRIEDTLIITSGAPRVITEWPKELMIL